MSFISTTGTGKDKKISLFGSSPKKNEQTDFNVEDVNNRVNSAVLRVRMLEERYTNMRRKVQVIEQNMISNHKRSGDEDRVINSELTEIKREISELKERFREMIMELKNYAQKQDVTILQKYVNLWNPTEFVRRDEVEKIVKEVLDTKND